jgi:hypothetical protein
VWKRPADAIAKVERARREAREFWTEFGREIRREECDFLKLSTDR